MPNIPSSTTNTAPSTARRMTRGAGWMILARFADRAIGLVSMLVLARVLTPTDFGLVAMAMSVIGLIELMGAFGFEVSLVRAQNPTRAHYDSVWTLNVIFAAICGACIALLALPTALFYAEERVISVMLVLAVCMVLGGFENVGIVDFRRNLEFGRDFNFLISKRVTGFLVTVPLAVVTESYWALIAGTFASRFVGLILSYLMHPYRPSFCLRVSRELFAFSIWIFVHNIVNFANARAVDFVIGRYHGPSQLGIYKLGEEIGYLAGSELVAPVNRALLPGLSRRLEEGGTEETTYISVVGITALIVLPTSLGLGAVADPLVRVLLGEKWLGTIPVIELIAIYSIFVSISATHGTMAIAAGLPRLPAIVVLIRLIIFAPLLVLWVPEGGAQAAAMAALVSASGGVLLGMPIIFLTLGIRPIAYLSAIWRPVVAALVMVAFLRILFLELSLSVPSMPDWLRLFSGVGAGAIVFFFVSIVLYWMSGRPRGAEFLVLEWLRSIIRKRRL